MAVSPGHDVESLKISTAYPHIEKSGVLDTDGNVKKDVFHEKFGKINPLNLTLLSNESGKEDGTNLNKFVLSLLEDSGLLFRSFKFQNASYRDIQSGERILMLTKDSWFMRVSDKLKMRCL